MRSLSEAPVRRLAPEAVRNTPVARRIVSTAVGGSGAALAWRSRFAGCAPARAWTSGKAAPNILRFSAMERGLGGRPLRGKRRPILSRPSARNARSGPNRGVDLTQAAAQAAWREGETPDSPRRSFRPAALDELVLPKFGGGDRGTQRLLRHRPSRWIGIQPQRGCHPGVTRLYPPLARKRDRDGRAGASRLLLSSGGFVRFRAPIDSVVDPGGQPRRPKDPFLSLRCGFGPMRGRKMRRLTLD
jgi:hypothetical protein